jgi:flagellar basal body-associated protein FliL
MGLFHPRMLSLVVSALGLVASLYFVVGGLSASRKIPALAPMREPAAAVVASSESTPHGKNSGEVLVSLDEVLVNINSRRFGTNKSLAVKVDLELFDESGKGIMDKRQAGLRDAIIGASSEQDYESLTTSEGKLYFKEMLVGRMNEYLKHPVVRDVHFAMFYLN